MDRPTLSEIGAHFKTDKGPANHNYLRHYERYFDQWRDQPITFLEIGVMSGASLKTWQEYFSQAKIIGLDVESGCLKYKTERVTPLLGDATDPDFISYVIEQHGPFDVVMDDGSHRGEQQKASFDLLYPSVKNGGLYIVEDVHTSYWNNQSVWGEPYTPHLQEHIDRVIYPCPSIFTDYADRRNAPNWDKFQGEMTDYEKQTMSIHIYTGTVVYMKWSEQEAEKWNKTTS